MDLKAHIRQIPDFPKSGILFYDISTLLQAPAAWRVAIDQLAVMVSAHRPDRVVGIESRGFIVAAPIAVQLQIGFGMVRKRGKLPGSVVTHAYSLEYGLDEMEMHKDAVRAGERVILVDDLVATGGTAEAAVKLLRQMGAEIVAACFVIDLPDLGGRRRLEALGVPVHTLVDFEGH